MSIALILKLFGAVIIASAHRALIRSAREEGTGWWIATLVIPGAAIVYGLRYFREFASALLAIVFGACITAGGYGLAIYDAVKYARETAEHGESIGAGDYEDEDDDDENERPVAFTPVVLGTKSIPADLRERIAQIQKRHAEITAERAQLDVENEDAVRAFNLRAAEYHAALAQLKTEVAQYQPAKPGRR